MQTKQAGFTIVELLIVIVVIGILAAITIVSYNGIQGKANDAAVQSDLRSFGTKITEFIVVNGRLPVPGMTDFGTMGIKVTRSAYGSHYNPTAGNNYNLLYCATLATDPNTAFGLVAASKSGKLFVYRNGSVQEGVGKLETHTKTCVDNMLPNASTMWNYNLSSWQTWIQ